ncbi:MAG: glycosyltransferase [Pseudomonas sp.]|nr:glycosyltransferase [Pseudomonas sp.]
MRTFFLAASLLIGISPVCMAAQIYKWVDAQGVTHFDAQPPQGQDATTVVTPSPPAGKPDTLPRSTAIGDQQAIDKSVKKQVAEQQAQLKVFCEQARTNLAQLQNNPRLREDVDGEMRRLTDEQRQERTTEAQKQIAENCQ